MNNLLLILLGVVGTVLASLAGLIMVPNYQARDIGVAVLTDTEGSSVAYPRQLDPYTEAPGRKVYMAQGCIYCHSQQVRDGAFGADIERGWGERRSVPRDYLLQSPPLLGTMRTGPDLANIGNRQPADAWHHLHLYDARLVTPESIMPPFKYLYSLVHQEPAAGAYRLPDTYLGKPSWIVPSPAAQQLVAYLKALHQDHTLAEVQ